MIILDATTKKLQIVLSGAVTTTELPWVVSYVDVLSSDQSVSAIAENDGATNGGTAVDMVAAPSAGHTRTIKTLTVVNKDTASATVEIRYNNNGTTRTIWKGALAVGDNLCYEGA